MPTYEYRCTACKHEFEKFQRMSDEPKAECPVCGKDAERRFSAGAGLHFKGSGFYITDYRSDSYKKAAGSEGGSGGGAEKSASDKTGSDKSSSSKSSGDRSGGEKGASSAKPEPKSGGSKDD